MATNDGLRLFAESLGLIFAKCWGEPLRLPEPGDKDSSWADGELDAADARAILIADLVLPFVGSGVLSAEDVRGVLPPIREVVTCVRERGLVEKSSSLGCILAGSVERGGAFWHQMRENLETHAASYLGFVATMHSRRVRALAASAERCFGALVAIDNLPRRTATVLTARRELLTFDVPDLSGDQTFDDAVRAMDDQAPERRPDEEPALDMIELALAIDERAELMTRSSAITLYREAGADLAAHPLDTWPSGLRRSLWPFSELSFSVVRAVIDTAAGTVGRWKVEGISAALSVETLRTD